MSTITCRFHMLATFFYTSVFFVLSILFFPGIMTPDSDFQLIMARSGSYTDWHPPILSLIWMPIDALWPGPAGMMFVFIALYTISYLIIVLYLARSSFRLASAVAIISVLPPSVNFVGVIWKDVLVAVTFLLATALALHRERGLHIITLGIFLTAIGIMARHNAAIAAAPIVYLLAYGSINPGWLKFAIRLFAVTFVCIFFAFFVKVTLPYFINIRETHPISSLLIFDLLALSAKSGTNLLPGRWTPEESAFILSNCYESRYWDRFWLSCGFAFERMQQEGDWAKLGSVWAKEVFQRLPDYLVHRAMFVYTNFVIFDQHGVFPVTTDTGKAFALNTHHKLMSQYVMLFADTKYTRTLFSMSFWIVASVPFAMSVFIIHVLYRPKTLYSLALALCGFLYNAPLFFVNPSHDLRYVYFGLIAMLLSIAFLRVDHPRRP